MTKSSLRERLARLGPVRTVSPVRSGSPVVVSLRPSSSKKTNTVAATLTLAKHGLSLLRAKRIVEEMIGNGRAVAEIPKVQSRMRFATELAEIGVIARPTDRALDIRKLREAMHLTQEQFALRYGFDLSTLQNWESKRRRPDKAVSAYLRVIERLPSQTSEAQEDRAPGSL